jgi:hypothetical protein
MTFRTVTMVSLFGALAIATSACGGSEDKKPVVGARKTKGSVPAAAGAKVKQVKAVTKSGKTTVAPVTVNNFNIVLPQEKFVLVFIGVDNAPVASVQFAQSAGGKAVSYIPAAPFLTDVEFDFGVINIDFTTHIALATTNIYTVIDFDGDGIADFADDDDDGDGTADAADTDDDDDGIDDSSDDLDDDGDGVCDMADDDDDGDGISDDDDTDDDGDGIDDEIDQDADEDGVPDDLDADDDNDGVDDDADTDDNGDGVDDDSQDVDGDGIPDYEDDDQDGDGQNDDVDTDDDNDGIPDVEDETP